MSELGAVFSQNASTLEEINFSWNEIGDDALGTLSQSLKRCKVVRYLYLSGCGLTSVSGQVLSGVVSCLPLLVELFINMNDLEDDGLEKLAGGLQLCTHLQSLATSDLGLSSRSVPVLAKLVSSAPSLKVLHAGQNFRKDVEKQLLGSVGGHVLQFI